MIPIQPQEYHNIRATAASNKPGAEILDTVSQQPAAVCTLAVLHIFVIFGGPHDGVFDAVVACQSLDVALAILVV
jgi:hypothetical protein